jgi:crotonobetainyl-CoA:carnitine CoA-transferase CaiB-like acyl-CoA transferase
VGPIRTINSPYKFVQNPAFVHSLTPGLGEQTDAILNDLDYRDGDIAELREAKVIL